ncbi:UDP-3-O-acyl-N-acetylglucosamine deacetylase [Nanoarchaeota archaeon]
MSRPDLQTTINRPVVVKGINIFNNLNNQAVFHPAKQDSGLAFLLGKDLVEANLENAKQVQRTFGRTLAVENGNAKIHIVEHILSSVYALGIDNLVIELSDDTCPTTDNCGKEYFEALKRAGLYIQDSPKEFWEYSKESPTLLWSNKDNTHKKEPCSLEVMHGNGFNIRSKAFYNHKAIGNREFLFDVSPSNYEKEVMSARPPIKTKYKLPESLVDITRSLGIHGATKTNYCFLSEESNGDPNMRGFRYDGNELVRHKMLDILGTLALTGRHFKNTYFEFNKTDHKFDIYALKELFNKEAFRTYAPKESLR